MSPPSGAVAVRASALDVDRVERSDSLARKAYRTLRRAIRNGSLAPGQVYSEAQTAALLGISRTPVREALSDLNLQGVITKVPQQGFRLRELVDDERDEVYALRTLIETEVVRRLARRTDEDGIRALEAIVRRQELSIGDLVTFAEAGEDFHLALASYVGPRWTAQIIEMLRGILWLSGLESISRPGRFEGDVAEHRQIIAAIAAHDEHAAERALVEHLEATRFAEIHPSAPTRSAD